jgi:DNA gyrase inhibitor GyrI
MSAGTPTPGEDRPRDHPPAFDLRSEYDDPDDPEMVTIRPDDPGDTTTEWLTIDAGFAVPVEETV